VEHAQSHIERSSIEKFIHSEGEPSTEPFRYEFIDGTSTGFWPKEGEEGGQVSFDPTFAVLCLQRG
jgi:hypothetical protein